MNTGAPYREPCGGWRKSTRPGGCFQHWRHREAYFPVYANDTLDKSSNIPEARSERWATKVDGELSVDLADCATGEGYETTAHNCLTLLPDRTKNLAICQKIGWKGVQARKFWHGRVPFTSWEDGDCTTEEVDEAAPTTRYRSFTIEMWWEVQSWGCKDGENGTKVTAGSSYARTTTIAKDSGLATSSNCSKAFSVVYTGSSPPVCPDLSSQNESSATWNPLQTYKDDGSPAMPIQVCGGEWVGLNGEGGFIDWYDNDWDVEKEESVTATAASYEITFTPKNEESWDVYIKCGVTLTLGAEYDADALMEDIEAMLEEWDLTDDAVYPWRYDVSLTTCPLVTRNEVESARSPEFIFGPDDDCDELDPILQDPNASYIDGSLRGAPFTDGYPAVFTEDTVGENFDEEDIVSSAIQLPETAHEINTVKRYDTDDVLQATGTVNTDYTFYEDCQKVLLTPSTPSYTNPLLPVDEGDYIEINYDRKLDVTGGLFDVYRESSGPLYGKWSGGVIPHSARQWTPDNLIETFPPFAFLKLVGGALWAQKYAEIKNPWRSQSWFGPCGAHRDAKIGSDFRWPNAWPIEGDRGATFQDMGGGTVRVTLSSAAAYLRDEAENVAAGTGASGDLVDFTTADGLTVLDNSGAGFEVTDTGSGWFEFSGTMPAAQYTRVKSHSAPGFWWYDSDGKGDYLKNEWVFDYRDISSALDPDEEVRAEQLTYYSMPREVKSYTCQTHCLTFDRCAPSVLCFSPNTETDSFDHGETFPFDESESFVMDAKFGSLWIGSFRQIMDDLWHTPSDDVEDIEDDGGCNSSVPDATVPHRPVVEARATVPASWLSGDSGPDPDTYYSTDVAPALGFTERDGEYRLFLELVDMQADGHDGIVQLPITDMSVTPTEPWAPWRVWSAMQTCICNEGSFGADYEEILPIWVCGQPEAICSGHYPV